MKYIILFTLFSCLSFSLIGQPSATNRKIPSQLSNNFHRYDLTESFALSNYHMITKSKSNTDNLQLKNTLIQKQKLDSVLIMQNNGFVTEKNLFKYDSKGNLINNIWFVGNEIDGLHKYRMYDYIYDDFDNIISQTENVWDQSLNIWNPRFFKENTYNNNKLSTSIYWIDWNQDLQKYENRNKDEYVYDNSGRVKQIKLFRWNENSKSWSFNEYYDYLYDEYGNHTLQTLYSNLEPWVQTSLEKWDNSYDSNKNLILSISYNWDSNTGTYKKHYREEYSYNEFGVLLTSKWSYFKEEYGDFVYERRSMTEYLYANNGDLLSITTSDFDTSINNWILNEKMVFNNDETVNNDDLILPSDWDFLSKSDHKIVKIGLNYLKNGDLMEMEKMQFYYSPFEVTGVFQDQNQVFSAYPNPSSEAVTFNWTSPDNTLSIELFHVSGTLVLDQIVTKGNPVSIKQFEKGIYTYKFSDGNKILYTGKLLLY